MSSFENRNTRLNIAVLAISTVSLFVLAGCASTANRGDLATASGASRMSAEQCAANAEITKAALRADAADPSSYVIQPGDELLIDFYLNPEFNDDVIVRPDGKVALRLVGDVQAAGLTPKTLAGHLDHAYLSELRAPGVSVHVKNTPSREVYVEGQVGKPSALPLEPGMTILQAIAAAGGVTEDASSEAVVIRRDACGVQQGSVVNLASARDDPARGEDVALMPRDVVVVPRSAIANVNLFVKQYIRNNLPVSPYLGLPL